MSLKETYHRIKKNEYYIPAKVPHSAQMLIIKMLRPDPNTRPTMKEVFLKYFFSSLLFIRFILSLVSNYILICRNITFCILYSSVKKIASSLMALLQQACQIVLLPWLLVFLLRSIILIEDL